MVKKSQPTKKTIKKPKFSNMTYEDIVHWHKENKASLPKSYLPGGRYYKAAKKYGEHFTLDELRGHGKPAGYWTLFDKKGVIPEDVRPRNMKEASKLGSYYQAIEELLKGNPKYFEEWKKHFRTTYIVDENGKRRYLITDIETIKRLHEFNEIPTSENANFSGKGAA